MPLGIRDRRSLAMAKTRERQMVTARNELNWEDRRSAESHKEFLSKCQPEFCDSVEGVGQ